MPEQIAVIRPATTADLEHFYAFALASGPGITSLPRNETFLEKLLTHSEHSFSSTLLRQEKETYLFCLEWEKKVIGSSGIVSRIGIEEPFFAFHKRVEKYHSSSFDFSRDIPILYFVEARKKPTEIGTLYLEKEFRGQAFGPLLSFARFLFIALFRKRFASTVIAEMRGINEEGISPFWEAIGRHFFGLDFSEADHLRITNPEVIKDLFPRHPLYTILLPQEAQAVIGHPHPKTEPAMKMLNKQGFRMSEYVDIFDGGPHLFAPTHEIDAVKNSHRAVVQELRHQLETPKRAIIANTSLDFRACSAPLLLNDKGRATLSLEVSSALKIDIGDEIIYYGIIGDT